MAEKQPLCDRCESSGWVCEEHTHEPFEDCCGGPPGIPPYLAAIGVLILGAAYGLRLLGCVDF